VVLAVEWNGYGEIVRGGGGAGGGESAKEGGRGVCTGFF